jgi:lysophospholipase L1-like esterase
MAPFHIIALGSSFAAGAGIPPYVDRTAFRSGNNYANILATRLGARLTDLSVSGAKLANLIDEPQVLLGRRCEPQLLGIPADANIVTITAGGNDLSYAGSMFGDSLRAYLVGRLFMPSAPQIAPMDASALTERFITLIDKIQEKAPRAHIFLVEYLTLLGPHTRAGIDVAFDESRIQYHQKVADALSVAYRRAGEARPQVTVVPMAERSLNHALGSEQPWVDPLSIYGILRGKPCLHPNLEGMQAVADVLYERLKNYEPTD